MNHILLVEDDPAITTLLSLHFQPPAFQLVAHTRGMQALQQLQHQPFDLIILDILLPDTTGFDLCRHIRADNKKTPILMLSALGQELDKVRALELGADDYLTKPFGVAELMARVRALLRRVGVAENIGENIAGDISQNAAKNKPPEPTTTIAFLDLKIDKDKKKVTMRGRRLDLTPKEFDLLWLLATHPGKTFSRHELLETIWGFAFQEYEHTVTSHINRLRIKIEPDLNKPRYILTTWGAGYRFAE